MVKKKLIICTVFILYILLTLQSFASESLEPDPTFKLVATFFPIDGGRLEIGNIDSEKKTFRLHLSNFGNKNEKIYYYADATIFVDENGEEEPDNAMAVIEYPQYTRSVIGDTYRRASVRILFSRRGEGGGLFKEAGHVIYQKCSTNKFEKKDWKCTGWEYLGRLPLP